MEREQLHNFIVLSEKLNFSEAADSLFLTQSALSKRIKVLEKELGQKLFIRNTRNIELSDFGKAFVPYAKQILVAYESTDMFIQNYENNHSHNVILGSIRNPQCFGIDQIFALYQKEYPHINLSLIEGKLYELENLYKIGKIKLYCTCDIMKMDNETEFIPVGSGRLAVVLPANDYLAKKEEITASDLKNRNLLLPSKNDIFYNLIINRFEQENMTPSIVYNGGGVSSIALVKAGIGIAILPYEMTKQYMDDSVCALKIFSDISYLFGLGHRPMKMLSSSEKTFVKFVKEYKSNK